MHEDEIEITPRMIEAGEAEWHRWDADDPVEWKLVAVFRAMVAAKVGIGSAVRLNSGGPRMMVSKMLPDAKALVEWADKSATFPLACLTPV